MRKLMLAHPLRISFPWCIIDGAPVGLSVIGARGTDARVIAAAQNRHDALSS
ncbi:hypothetical protein [Bordetella sp. H567]|uniref:hypothetical protein n=1 Tax=Bordetella sp. H567 TaxID=1697043 RepID=UPI001313E432|nr:hypothetical protein [Bordetella sp. H567]